MINFHYLKKLTYSACGLTAFKYALWSAFFVFQGWSIELALSGDELNLNVLYKTLGLYVLTKLLVMLTDVGYEWLQSILKNKEMYYQWTVLYPSKLYADNVNKKNEFKLMMFEYLPELFESKYQLFTNRFTIGYLFLLIIIYFIFTRFYMGILMLICLFLLNYLSKNRFAEKIDRHQKITQNLKQQVLRWSDDFFDGYQEISKNWDPEVYTSWHQSVYQALYQSNRQLTLFYAIRDLVCQCLVELPFVLNTALVILFVYWRHLSIAQLFVWMGMSQFMMTASTALSKNKILAKRNALLHESVEDILKKFHVEPEETFSYREVVFDRVDVYLQDGTLNTLGITPGLYRIQGKNGSGKTTLLNQIKGFNREKSLKYCSNTSHFIAHANKKNIRLVERDAVVFNELALFSGQVVGPFDCNEQSWLSRIKQNMERYLSIAITAEWIAIFSELQIKYDEKKGYQPSSGERIILSWARLWCYWDATVDLILIDECDGFLDRIKRMLFAESLRCLSVSIPIFMVSH